MSCSALRASRVLPVHTSPASPQPRPLQQRRLRHLCTQRLRCVHVAAEKKEYYDYKDMPPLPMTVKRIHVPSLGYTVVDKSNEVNRMASLAIFYDISQDEQYRSRLTRKSAITALCMYDQEEVEAAQRTPGDYPNIDLLFRVYNQGLDLEFVVEEITPQR